MNNLNKPKFKITPKQVFWFLMVISAILLCLITWIYFAEPFSQFLSPFWDDNLAYVLMAVPSLGAAIAGVLVVRQFDRSEQPHRVWQAFTIGLWCWVAGEIIWILHGLIFVDVPYPDFGLSDAAWLLGYFFLGLSLYYQIKQVYGLSQKWGLRFYLGMIMLTLLITALLTTLATKVGLGEGYSWIILFVGVLYPVFDLAEGGIAIWLSFLFGRGRWSRPWWGLILFALADGIDAFYWMGGYEKIPLAAQSVLDVISVVVYPSSYMVAGLALLSNYFILRYGEESGLLKSARKSGLDMVEK